MSQILISTSHIYQHVLVDDSYGEIVQYLHEVLFQWRFCWLMGIVSLTCGKWIVMYIRVVLVRAKQ